MSKTGSMLIVLLAAGMFLAGCAKEEQIVSEPYCGANIQKEQAIKAAEDVLGEMHFSIEKSDVEAGVVRTRPLPGAQFFEFWRKDTIGAYNREESNLHSTRRTVELDFSARNEGWCIMCIAKIQRLSLPERTTRSGAHMYEMFSKSEDSAIQKLDMDPEQKKGMYWIDLGRDGRLENEVLKRLEQRINGDTGEKVK
jgi:hypothetical protein